MKKEWLTTQETAEAFGHTWEAWRTNRDKWEKRYGLTKRNPEHFNKETGKYNKIEYLLKEVIKNKGAK